MHSVIHRALALLTLAFCLACSLRASAESTDTEATDRAQYRQAAQEINDKNWLEAHRLLSELWIRKKTFDVAASLGQTEYQLHRSAEGAGHLAFALAHVPPKESGDIVRGLHAALEEIKKVVATVHVSVNQPGATVWVDGQQIGTAPLDGDVFVEPGRRVVEARPGSGPGAPDTKALTLEAGHEYTIQLTLATPPPETRTEQTVNLPPAVERESGVQPRTVVLIAGSVVTAALLGVGVAERVRASNAQDDADARKAEATEALGHNCPLGSTLPECQRLNGALDDRNGANEASTWCFVGAGIAAAATATLYVVLPHKKTESPADLPRISFVPTPHSSSLHFSTAF